MNKLVIIESPYAGDVTGNILYAQRCVRDSLMRGESPYASHLLYTQENILDDNDPADREMGISAGFAWKHHEGTKTVFYTDRGISSGMRQALAYCIENKLPYEFRRMD